MSEFRDRIVEEYDPEVVFLGTDEGEFDDAIIGIAEVGSSLVLVYDRSKVLDILTDQFSSDPDDPDVDPAEDALEWYGYNILGGGAFDGGPVYLVESFVDK